MKKVLTGNLVAEAGHVVRYASGKDDYYVFWPGIKKGKPKRGMDDGDLSWVKAELRFISPSSKSIGEVK